MLKRSYADLSSKDITSVSQILEHAEDLLSAAIALKLELAAFRDTPELNGQIISVLELHNKKILPIAQLLDEDEVSRSLLSTSFGFVTYTILEQGQESAWGRIPEGPKA